MSFAEAFDFRDGHNSRIGNDKKWSILNQQGQQMQHHRTSQYSRYPRTMPDEKSGSLPRWFVTRDDYSSSKENRLRLICSSNIYASRDARWCVDMCAS